MSNSRALVIYKRHSVKKQRIYTHRVNIQHENFQRYNEYSPLNTCGFETTTTTKKKHHNQSGWPDDDIRDQSSCRYYDNISIFRDVNKPRVRDSTTLQYSIAH